MSKLHDPDDAVSMRLLSNDGFDGSTVVGGDEDGWAMRRPPLRTPSPDDSYLTRFSTRRVLLRVLCAGVLATIVGVLFVVSRKPIADRISSWRTPPERLLPSFQDHSLYVASQPAPRFRDNLVNGTKYVTAWPIGGFTNQVMAQVNLLYLAVLVGRIPVIADFVPGHMHGNPGYLPVSDVYDLPRLAESLHIPVLEWSEFKNRSLHEQEELGCWSPHATIFGSGGHFASEHEFSLDISLTPVPDSHFISGRNHLNIMALASLGWPQTRASAVAHAETEPSKNSKHTMKPDETMLCYDELYYSAATKDYEWFEDWVPAWTQVGRYMRWEPRMEELARSYVLRAFGLAPADPFPSYISVHIRHTDFAQLCGDDPPENCFPPLSAYGEKIEEIKRDLLELHGVSVDSVLVASDEENPTWWNSVTALGWHRIDWEAEKTEEIYSEWYPIVLDSICLSLGKGFVGTTKSTLSLLAAKRVQDWEDGPVREVHLNT